MRPDINNRAPETRGFTLIEILIVVAIIAVLAAILIPNFYRAQTQSKVSASRLNLRHLGLALESYHTENPAYPVSASPADANIVLTPLVPNFMPEIPADPCTGNPYKYKSADGTTYELTIDFPTGNRCDSEVGTIGDSVDLTYSPTGLKEGP